MNCCYYYYNYCVLSAEGGIRKKTRFFSTARENGREREKKEWKRKDNGDTSLHFLRPPTLFHILHGGDMCDYQKRLAAWTIYTHLNVLDALGDVI